MTDYLASLPMFPYIPIRETYVAPVKTAPALVESWDHALRQFSDAELVALDRRGKTCSGLGHSCCDGAPVYESSATFTQFNKTLVVKRRACVSHAYDFNEKYGVGAKIR